MRKYKISLLLLTLSMTAPSFADQQPHEPSQAEQNKVDGRAATFIHDTMIANNGPVHGAFYWGGKEVKGARHIYMFIDPNCSVCHNMYGYLKKLEPAMNKYKVQPVIIPIAFLKPDSAGKAASMVKDGWTAFEQNEEKYRAPEVGGATPLPSTAANASYFYQLKTNLDLAMGLAQHNGYGSTGTPFTLFLDRNGNWDTFMGVPNTPDLFVRAVTDSKSLPWDGKLN